jgi:hypothetical protein
VHAQLLKEVSALKRTVERKTVQNIQFDGYSFEVDDPADEKKKKTYVPSQTALDFHSDDSLVRVIRGPFGSGKSTMCAAEIVRRACLMPAWFQGRRRSKWAIIRNTSGELETTTLETWMNWFGVLGSVNRRSKPVLTIEHSFNDGNGIVDIKLLFLALDNEKDLRKVRSLEVTGVYINEISETPSGILGNLQGRINRYPAKDICKYWSGIIADANPPDTDHWLYKAFEVNRPEEYAIFSQPPGLIKDENEKWVNNPEAENIDHVGHDYYPKLAVGQTQEFIKVFCLGQYGSVIHGKKVYPEYNDDIHSRDVVNPVEGLPLLLGFDFGLTPACVVAQHLPSGQLRILHEFCGFDIGLREFLSSTVIPGLNEHFFGYEIEIAIPDPSGKKGVDTDKETCFEILEANGFKTVEVTNDLIPRLESVRYFLNKMVSGEPAILVSRRGCPLLRKGWLGDYKYRRMRVLGEERYQDKPDKNSASHPQDAVQYIAVYLVLPLLTAKKQADLSAFYSPTISVL